MATVVFDINCRIRYRNICRATYRRICFKKFLQNCEAMEFLETGSSNGNGRGSVIYSQSQIQIGYVQYSYWNDCANVPYDIAFICCSMDEVTAADNCINSRSNGGHSEKNL